MCGLAAIVGKQAHHNGAAFAAMERMCARMKQRGPDGQGTWHDAAAGVTLGHRRLAVIDLDSRADQPMISPCGRWIIVFNGEIYNFMELREALLRDGAELRTHSDTEVLLMLYARHGENMLAMLRGMYAFAVWDTRMHRLFLARDPYGIKPLYYATTPTAILVASQVKALVASGQVSREPDPQGQAGFWLLGSVAEPHTWFRDIKALPAGHYTYVDASGIEPPRRYWDVATSWREAPVVTDRTALISQDVRESLLSSVRAHLVSDVPVGVLLSGGIDSTCLIALMKEAGASPHGITIAFREYRGGRQDEAPFAAMVAAEYGLRHDVREVTHEEFEDDLPRILDAMDQPSIDGINTWFATKAAAEQGLKVVVSGVGADELFQGYASFRELPRLVRSWRVVSRVPGVRALSRLFSLLQSWRSENPRWALAPALTHDLRGAWFLRRSVFAPHELAQLIGSAGNSLASFDPIAWVESLVGVLPANLSLGVGQLESAAYLRNQLLRDSDWASMDHGVELRTPYVDAFLLRELQPVLSAFGGAGGKNFLAQAPITPLPDAVRKRRKVGFCIPVADWMRQHAGEAALVSTGGGGARNWARHIAAAYDEGVGRCV